ncbi:protein C52B11.1 [Aphelenchoides avenae]|nr:protein C52B11.1 [Aphelenchus avenae]
MRRNYLLMVAALFLAINSARCEEEDASLEAKDQPKKKRVPPSIDAALCGDGTSAFLVSDNTDAIGNHTRLLSNITEEECMNHCRDNRDPGGRIMLCGSFVYHHESFECRIFRRDSVPDGPLNKTSAVGKRYFEKFCLGEGVPVECANKQFPRVDEFILKGYAQSSAIVPSLAECISECMRTTDFECKSAMYFYEEGECITNIASANEHPEDFAQPEDGDKVIFMQNGCVTEATTSSESTKEQSTTQELLTTEEPTTTTKASAAPTTTEKDEEPSATEEAPKAKATKSTKKAAKKTTTEAPKEPTSNATEAVTDETTEAASKPTTSPATEAETDLFESTNATKAIRKSRPTTETPLVTADTSKTKDASAASTMSEADAPSTPTTEEKSEESTIPIKKHPKDIDTRLYGAKRLEMASDGTLKLQEDETKDDIVVEDRVEKTTASEPAEWEEPPANGPPSPPPKALSPRKPKPGVLDTTKKLAIKELPPLEDRPQPTSTTEQSNGSGGEDGSFSKWGNWTECTQPGERRIRRRKCLDLRRCRGALMQVGYCPRDIGTTQAPETESTDGPVGPVRSPLPVAREGGSSAGSPPSILPQQLPQKELKPLPAGAPAFDEIWTPWTGVCQQFASTQPCKNSETIGFEARECIAKDPRVCKGPFFRYCTAKC